MTADNHLVSAVMYEYCVRGSLQDLILDPSFRMNKLFRNSFAINVASGLEYLHSRKIVHGRLKSTSCIIDKHWTVRISGKCAFTPS